MSLKLCMIKNVKPTFSLHSFYDVYSFCFSVSSQLCCIRIILSKQMHFRSTLIRLEYLKHFRSPIYKSRILIWANHMRSYIKRMEVCWKENERGYKKLSENIREKWKTKNWNKRVKYFYSLASLAIQHFWCTSHLEVLLAKHLHRFCANIEMVSKPTLYLFTITFICIRCA